MRKYGRLFETEFAKIKTSSGDTRFNGVTMHQEERLGFSEVWVSLNDKNELGRDAGNYITFYITEKNDRNLKALTLRLSFAIKKLCGEQAKRVLFLGMGNAEIISDALGTKTLEILDMGEFASFKKQVQFAKFCPGVFAVSGFQSFEIVKALTSIFLPDVVIVVDSLCAGSVSRLGNCVQLTDAGITPGSAVGGKLSKLSSETLGGVRVVSIGVPVVIYLQSVIEEATQKLKPLEDKSLEVLDDFDGIFSPKEIDEIINDSSKLIANAIRKAFI